MILVAAIRPIVESWVREFDSPQVAYERLSTNSSITADGWRKRLSDTVYKEGRGWWSLEEIDDADADELLTAMGMQHLLANLSAPLPGEKISAKVRLPGERRRIKRLSKAALLTREQIFAVHKLHIDGGLSMREIARRGWDKWGYASQKSCLNSLCDLLDSYGLARRDRIEATIRASTTHGRASRANKAEYKRWHRRAYGFWPSDRRPNQAPRPVCAGVRTQYPRKGAPCTRPALLDSEFCQGHDPRRSEVNNARLALARAARRAA